MHSIWLMRLLFRISFVLVLLSSTSLHAALTADNLLLIVNKNVPDGQKLAEYYAQQRHVPDGRILSLDLPAGDEMSVDDFDAKLVTPTCEFLIANHLKEKVTCVVTFYGVPLRIPARQSTADLRAELVSIRKQEAAAIKQMTAMLDPLEKLAAELDPSYKPMMSIGQMEVQAKLQSTSIAKPLSYQASQDAEFVFARINALPAGAKRTEFEARLGKLVEQFRAPVGIVEPTTAPTSAPATSEALTPPQIQERMAALSIRRGDPAARRAMRDLVRDHGGIIAFMRIVDAQDEYLTPDESGAPSITSWPRCGGGCIRDFAGRGICSVTGILTPADKPR